MRYWCPRCRIYHDHYHADHLIRIFSKCTENSHIRFLTYSQFWDVACVMGFSYHPEIRLYIDSFYDSIYKEDFVEKWQMFFKDEMRNIKRGYDPFRLIYRYPTSSLLA